MRKKIRSEQSETLKKVTALPETVLVLSGSFPLDLLQLRWRPLCIFLC